MTLREVIAKHRKRQKRPHVSHFMVRWAQAAMFRVRLSA
jgi:hypothetical protein